MPDESLPVLCIPAHPAYTDLDWVSRIVDKDLAAASPGAEVVHYQPTSDGNGHVIEYAFTWKEHHTSEAEFYVRVAMSRPGDDPTIDELQALLARKVHGFNGSWLAKYLRPGEGPQALHRVSDLGARFGLGARGYLIRLTPQGA